ncbi:MAG: acyltransferase [Clostridia bacterium]
MREILRTYRDELKGCAILWVVFSHINLELSGIWLNLQRFGYGGVDIFLFLTGFGLYCSLAKSEELAGYVRRRLWRILPAYLPFCVCWLAVMLPVMQLGTVQSIRTALGNLLMVGFFAGVPETISWYMSVLVLVIALAPFVFAVLRRSQYPSRMLVAMLALALGVGLCYVGDNRYMALSRIPVFLLGMGFALPSTRKMRKGMAAALCVLALIAGFGVLQLCFSRYPELLNDYGMYWHPFILVAPALCVALGWLMQKAQKISVAFAPLRALGRASFEIFLFNCWVEELCKHFGMANTPTEWVLWSVGSVLAGWLYHVAVEACVRKKRLRAA